jgi:hypothetical protein
MMDGGKSPDFRTTGTVIGITGLGMLIPGIILVATNKPSIELTHPLSGE